MGFSFRFDDDIDGGVTCFAELTCIIPSYYELEAETGRVVCGLACCGSEQGDIVQLYLGEAWEDMR